MFDFKRGKSMSFLLKNKLEHISKILSLVYTDYPKNDYDFKDIERVINRIEGLCTDDLSEQQLQLLQIHSGDICTDSPNCNVCPINKFCESYRFKCKTDYQQQLKKSITFVDLFSGIGGASLGFELAGFSPVMAVDFEANATNTYKFNRPYMPEEWVLNKDITEILDDHAIFKQFVPEAAQNPMVLIGGFPCQSFSNANRQRIIDDPRNRLYKYTVKAVSYFKPQAIILENVTGVKKIANQIIEDFEAVGYFVDFRIFDAKDFGVPQSRKRMFFVGVPYSSEKTDPIFLVNKVFSDIEARIDQNQRFVLKDALEGLRPVKASREKNKPDYENSDIGYKIDMPFNNTQNEYLQKINGNNTPFHLIFNHKARYNNDRDIEIFDRLPQGGKSDHPSIADIMPYKSRDGVFKDKYYKLIENDVCRTITAHMKFDCNMYIHPNQARGLTVREAARIQSFPDDYIITGTFQKLYEQVGNSVPPLMSKIIAEAVKENIFNEELICLK